MNLREVLDRRDLRNVAIVASGAESGDVAMVLTSIQSARSPSLLHRLPRAIWRDARRRLRGRAAPPPERRDRSRRVVVLSPEVRVGWDLASTGATHLEAASLVDINWQLKRLGPFDAIVDVSRDAGLPHDATWVMLFLHLRHQGVYVSVDRGDNPLAATLAAVQDGGGEKWAKNAVESVVSSGPTLVVEKRGRHYLKLRDHEVDRFLPTRDVSASSTLLAELPSGELQVRTEVVSHGSRTQVKGFEPLLKYPEMRMRHYTGHIALSTHSLLFADSTVLPESFRHHLHRRLSHTRIKDSNHQFGTLALSHRPKDRLRGVYYNLDSPFPGHFGHITTEVLSRLWGWDEAKRQFPELKAVWRAKDSTGQGPQLERQLFRAYGIDEQDMVTIDRPVWLDSVIGVTPMWHNNFPHYVHPHMAHIWKRIGTNLAEDPGFDVSKIFVSRKPELARSCRNGPAVEDVFRRHGFTVIYPEDHSLAQQAGIFKNAKVVAGFGGSAMFNMMFAESLTNLIVLTHEAYTARNEYLFASLLGGRTDYFWSPPEICHPVGGWTQEAFTSNWTFDFATNGAALEKLVDSLE